MGLGTHLQERVVVGQVLGLRVQVLAGDPGLPELVDHPEDLEHDVLLVLGGQHPLLGLQVGLA